MIDDAERADALAVSSMERNPGIEAHVRFTNDHRIVGKAIIVQRVADDQWFAV